MYPTIKLRAAGKSRTLINQTRNLQNWWKRKEREIFDSLDYYVNVTWQIEEIDVVLRQASGRKQALDCVGEVDINKPDMITLHVGGKIRWTPNNLVVFIHELVHCATLSGKDLRFGRPGVMEDWIIDELATDLFAQHIMRRAGIKLRPNTLSSIEYAFLDVARKIIRSRQFKEERVRLVKEIERKLRRYLKTTNKNYYSFRKALRSI